MVLSSSMSVVFSAHIVQVRNRTCSEPPGLGPLFLQYNLGLFGDKEGGSVAILAIVKIF